MPGPYVPSCQRNWYKLCRWNVRTDKERYTRGIIIFLMVNKISRSYHRVKAYSNLGIIFQASGGLKAFGNYLAEDYFFAQVRKLNCYSLNTR